MNLENYKSYLSTTRRYFHKHPEIGYDVQNTLKYIQDQLTSFGFTVYLEETGLIGELSNQQGHVIAIRSDVDALGIPDLTNCEYSSIYENRNHACGHDSHMAMLLGTCKYFSENKDVFKGTLKVIFQAAEEGPMPGGAYLLSQSEHLKDVEAFFALHIMSDYPLNQIVCKSGPFMAAVDIINIKIYGKSSHVANPHLGLNPIDALPDLLKELKELVKRENNLLGITQISCGETHNVISDLCLIRGSLRTYDEQYRKNIKIKIKEISQEISIKYSTKIDLNIEEGYPSVINDENLYISYKDLIISNFGEENFNELKKPVFLAEDFAYYQKKAPGIMAFLGTKNEEKGIIYPNHHYKFNIDESSLETGMKIHIQTVINYLK